MPRVSFHTLGCKLNYSETETLARQFGERSFEQVPFTQPADVCVINTCSVTEEADRKCRKAVRQALRANPDAYVIVVGCYAQLKPAEIAAIDGVDAVLGAAEKFRLFDLLPDFEKGHLTRVHRCTIEEAREFVPTWSQEGRTRSFLKIQDGCDYKCSFCTIPLARGASRSESPERVLAQAMALAAAGVQEVVLTGINLGDYGGPSGESFFDVLVLLEERSGLPRIRVSSIEPNLLEDRIIDRIAGSQRLMPHLHIPLQSGSDRILKLMRRRYVRQLYAERVKRIKRQMPWACVGCDVIVGFPGETEADFRETAAFLADLPVDYLHVFTFSERSDTPAAAMPDAVPVAVRRERNETLRLLSQRKRTTFDRQFEGTIRPVLWEKKAQAGIVEGLTDNYIAVQTTDSLTPANSIGQIKLTGYNATTQTYEGLGCPAPVEVRS
jgi:threonylcarbamoyladenosine tRNA methylthiotransferase MtaB